MHLTTHHAIAVAGATVTSGIALFDALTHGLTGSYSVFSDDSGVRTAQVLAAVAHGLPYLAFCAVLVMEAPLIRSAGRAAATLRWVLLASLGMLAAGFLLLAPFLGSPDGTLGAVFGGLATVGFAGMLLSGLLIGPFLVRTPGLRPGSWLLCAMLPVTALTVLLGLVAPDWAHPAYLETTLHFGIALLGVAAASAADSDSTAPGVEAAATREVGVLEHPGVHGDRGRG